MSDAPIDEAVITARVLAVKPHPEQATTHPNCWAVQFAVRYGRTTRTFWRWYNDRIRNGWTHEDRNPRPREEDILRRFWDDTFADLHGFSFENGQKQP